MSSLTNKTTGTSRRRSGGLFAVLLAVLALAGIDQALMAAPAGAEKSTGENCSISDDPANCGDTSPGDGSGGSGGSSGGGTNNEPTTVINQPPEVIVVNGTPPPLTDTDPQNNPPTSPCTGPGASGPCLPPNCTSGEVCSGPQGPNGQKPPTLTKDPKDGKQCAKGPTKLAALTCLEKQTGKPWSWAKLKDAVPWCETVPIEYQRLRQERVNLVDKLSQQEASPATFRASLQINQQQFLHWASVWRQYDCDVVSSFA